MKMIILFGWLHYNQQPRDAQEVRDHTRTDEPG